MSFSNQGKDSSLLSMDTRNENELSKKIQRLFEIELEDCIYCILSTSKETFIPLLISHMESTFKDLYGQGCFQNQIFNKRFMLVKNFFSSEIYDSIMTDLIIYLQIKKQSMKSSMSQSLNFRGEECSDTSRSSASINLMQIKNEKTKNSGFFPDSKPNSLQNIKQSLISISQYGRQGQATQKPQTLNFNTSTESKGDIQITALQDIFIRHCREDLGKSAIHVCGGKLVVVKNSVLCKKSVQYKNITSDYIVCEKCNYIAFSTSFLLRCTVCDESYYSYINEQILMSLGSKSKLNSPLQGFQSSRTDYLQVTWEKYHCPILLNDPIRCIKCRNEVYVNIRDYFNSLKSGIPVKYSCFTCNIETRPESLLWKCLACNKDFSCGIKLFNSLELKAYKLAIKDALVFNKVLAKPFEIPCCDYYPDSLEFFHSKACKGLLYLGTVKKYTNEFEDQKIIVCSLCKYISKSEQFVWTCPICNKRFRFKSDVTKKESKLSSPINYGSETQDTRHFKANSNMSFPYSGKESSQENTKKITSPVTTNNSGYITRQYNSNPEDNSCSVNTSIGKSRFNSESEYEDTRNSGMLKNSNPNNRNAKVIQCLNTSNNQGAPAVSSSNVKPNLQIGSIAKYFNMVNSKPATGNKSGIETLSKSVANHSGDFRDQSFTNTNMNSKINASGSLQDNLPIKDLKQIEKNLHSKSSKSNIPASIKPLDFTRLNTDEKLVYNPAKISSLSSSRKALGQPADQIIQLDEEIPKKQFQPSTEIDSRKQIRSHTDLKQMLNKKDEEESEKKSEILKIYNTKSNIPSSDLSSNIINTNSNIPKINSMKQKGHQNLLSFTKEKEKEIPIRLVTKGLDYSKTEGNTNNKEQDKQYYTEDKSNLSGLDSSFNGGGSSYIKKKVASKSKNLHSNSNFNSSPATICKDDEIDQTEYYLDDKDPAVNTNRSDGGSKFTFSKNKKTLETTPNETATIPYVSNNASQNNYQTINTMTYSNDNLQTSGAMSSSYNTITDTPSIYQKSKVNKEKGAFNKSSSNCKKPGMNLSGISDNDNIKKDDRTYDDSKQHTSSNPKTPQKDSIASLIREKSRVNTDNNCYKSENSFSNPKHLAESKAKLNPSLNIVSPVHDNIQSYTNFRPNKLLASENSILKQSIPIKIENKEQSDSFPQIIINTQNVPNINKFVPASECYDDIHYFNVEDYKLVEKIGEGTYGTIYSVRDENGNMFALKKIIASDEVELECFKQEYTMMQKIRHPFILTIYGICLRNFDSDITNTSILYVLMDLALTDWNKEIKKRKEIDQQFTIQELVNILFQVSSAMSFLQTCKISHRDIKPHNILKFSGNIYKIADFGEAKFYTMNPDEVFQTTFKSRKNATFKDSLTLRGTELYMSPLLFQGLKTNLQDIIHNPIKSDVYSLALCCLYSTFLKIDLLYLIRNSTTIDPTIKAVNKLILKDSRFNVNGGLYDWYFDLLFRMLTFKEDNRPDFIAVLKVLDKRAETVNIKIKKN